MQQTLERSANDNSPASTLEAGELGSSPASGELPGEAAGELPGEGTPSPLRRRGKGVQGRPAPWARVWLAALAQLGTPAQASAVCKINAGVPYRLRDRDARFAAAWVRAEEEYTQVLIAEVHRRATGYDAPVIYKGRPSREWLGPDGLPCEPTAAGAVLTPVVTRRHSDLLLMFGVKASDASYRDNYELSVKPADPSGGLSIDIELRRAALARSLAGLLGLDAGQLAGLPVLQPTAGQQTAHIYINGSVGPAGPGPADDVGAGI